MKDYLILYHGSVVIPSESAEGAYEKFFEEISGDELLKGLDATEVVEREGTKATDA